QIGRIQVVAPEAGTVAHTQGSGSGIRGARDHRCQPCSRGSIDLTRMLSQNQEGRNLRPGASSIDEETRQMRPSCKKILDYYEEGRITRTGAVLRLLDLTDQEEMREVIELLPPEVLEELRDFLENYRPDMLVFPGPPPKPAAVRMAKEVLAKSVE